MFGKVSDWIGKGFEASVIEVSVKKFCDEPKIFNVTPRAPYQLSLSVERQLGNSLLVWRERATQAQGITEHCIGHMGLWNSMDESIEFRWKDGSEKETRLQRTENREQSRDRCSEIAPWRINRICLLLVSRMMTRCNNTQEIQQA